LNGGWPVYEFSDGSAAFSGILRKPGGEPAIRLYAKSGADTPNRLTVEFQDEFNDYQQDSLSLVDVDDALLTQREVTATFPALGLPNFDQATRVLDLQLAKSTVGSTLVEFETTVRGVDLVPGDLITVTYLKEGLQRQEGPAQPEDAAQAQRKADYRDRWSAACWMRTGSTSSASPRR
jgi:Putative phage tail protein